MMINIISCSPKQWISPPPKQYTDLTSRPHRLAARSQSWPLRSQTSAAAERKTAKWLLFQILEFLCVCNRKVHPKALLTLKAVWCVQNKYCTILMLHLVDGGRATVCSKSHVHINIQRHVTTYDDFPQQITNTLLRLSLTSISSRSSFFLRRMFDSSSLSSRDRSSGTVKYRDQRKWESMCERGEGRAGLWGWIKLIHVPTSQSESQGLSLVVHTCSMNLSQSHYSWPKWTYSQLEFTHSWISFMKKVNSAHSKI